jgi:hypothetical protein
LASPGWSFFYDAQALPDDQLGVAQLSNRVLIPPDGLPFAGTPQGHFMGYTWMALPFRAAQTGTMPTGDQAWTCFLSAANFKGPIAYYIAETWSKIAAKFNYPYDFGRGLDARRGSLGGGAMEINTVPYFEARGNDDRVYRKIPELLFPVDSQNRSVLVQDVHLYSKSAMFDAFAAWRDGGAAVPARFAAAGEFKAALQTNDIGYRQNNQALNGVNEVAKPAVFDEYMWGLQWSSSFGRFPRYFRVQDNQATAIDASEVPEETGLAEQMFPEAAAGNPYTSPMSGAWAAPGPATPNQTTQLADGSTVTYRWYRFVDQPSFQQYNMSQADKDKLQAFVEKIHATWTPDKDYMAPPTVGALVTLDPGLFVTPPQGLEVGYVPIVVGQQAP